MAERGPGGKFLPKGAKAQTLQQKVEASDANTLMASVNDVSVDDIVKDLGYLQLDTQKKLADLSTALVNRFTMLRNVGAAIGLEEARLKDLHQIEAQAITLDELKSQEEQLRQEHERARQERDRQYQEEQTEREKRWAREEDEHTYVRTLTEKKARDMFQADMDANKRVEINRKESLEKSWFDREANLKARETELAEAKAVVATFPEKLKGEVSKAEAILTNILKRDYEHKVALAEKTMEGERALNSARVASLDGQIKSKDAQIAELQVQLTSARADAKSVAEKALDATSGKEVTRALQHAMEQQQPANNPTRR